MTSPLPTGTGTATLTEWNLAAAGSGKPVQGGVSLTVDFDPKSLQLKYAVSLQSPGQQTQTSGTQRNKAPAQWTSETTTLTLQLIFDSTTTGQSVQVKTKQLVQLTQPSPTAAGSKTPPSGKVVQFKWGSFCFYGSVTSLDQTIDYFAHGVPLRATIDLTLQEMAPPEPPPTGTAGPAAPASSFGNGVGVAGGPGAPSGFSLSASAGVSAAAGISASASAGASAAVGVSASVGTTPLTLSAAGDTVQSITALAGTGASWKVVAAANNIDNPRVLPPGTVLDLSATATASVSAGIQTS
jgi:Contractile injection system tube protein